MYLNSKAPTSSIVFDNITMLPRAPSLPRYNYVFLFPFHPNVFASWMFLHVYLVPKPIDNVLVKSPCACFMPHEPYNFCQKFKL